MAKADTDLAREYQSRNIETVFMNARAGKFARRRNKRAVSFFAVARPRELDTILVGRTRLLTKKLRARKRTN